MSYLQSNLDEKGCTAFSELREALETEAELVPLACFSKLVGGKSEQPAKCVEIGSGKESHLQICGWPENNRALYV